jgi:NAD(P)-dependent dehydrogenase (short-subunit alcohol dehydrogenase family)
MNTVGMKSEARNVAVVTGAGSGIGRSVAIGLFRHGFDVVLAGRNRDKLQATMELAGAAEEHMLVCEADVTLPWSVGQLFLQTQQAYGKLDLLFNNAGVNLPSTSIEDVVFDDWQRVVNTNLTGMFLCTQHAVRLMKEQDPPGGRIINNGSISAHSPRPGSCAYTSTKHAVTGLTKSTILDCRKYGIACGQVDIGNAESDMAANMKEGVPQADGSIAAEPTIDCQHVTDAVLYMAQLPTDVNVPFMTVMANGMPYIGRG